MMYDDYCKEVLACGKEFIDENFESYNHFDSLLDDMFDSDDVTGNGSGSYTFNTRLAQENVKDAIFDKDIILMFQDNSVDIASTLMAGAEALDATIRSLILYDIAYKLEDYYDQKAEQQEEICSLGYY